MNRIDCSICTRMKKQTIIIDMRKPCGYISHADKMNVLLWIETLTVSDLCQKEYGSSNNTSDANNHT